MEKKVQFRAILSIPRTRYYNIYKNWTATVDGTRGKDGEDEAPKKISRQTPIGRRTQGRPKIRYIEQIEQDIGTLKIRNWRSKARDRSEWRKIFKQAKTHKGLSSQ